VSACAYTRYALNAEDVEYFEKWYQKKKEREIKKPKEKAKETGIKSEL
jgi:hypothetical protein